MNTTSLPLHKVQFRTGILAKTLSQSSFGKLVKNAFEISRLHWYFVQSCTENWLLLELFSSFALKKWAQKIETWKEPRLCTVAHDPHKCQEVLKFDLLPISLTIIGTFFPMNGVRLAFDPPPPPPPAPTLSTNTHYTPNPSLTALCFAHQVFLGACYEDSTFLISEKSLDFVNMNRSEPCLKNETKKNSLRQRRPRLPMHILRNKKKWLKSVHRRAESKHILGVFKKFLRDRFLPTLPFFSWKVWGNIWID